MKMFYYKKTSNSDPEATLKKLDYKQLKSKIRGLEREIQWLPDEIEALKVGLQEAEKRRQQFANQRASVLEEEKRRYKSQNMLKKLLAPPISPEGQNKISELETEYRLSSNPTYREIHKQILKKEMQLKRHAQLKQIAEEVFLPEAEKKFLLEQEKKTKEKKKLVQKVALAAAYEKKGRELAVAVKKQLQLSQYCPYCLRPIGESPHADHIYPISMGGLSVEENMVFVCNECNQKKEALTLREFIQKHRLDRQQIEEALLTLGKNF